MSRKMHKAINRAACAYARTAYGVNLTLDQLAEVRADFTGDDHGDVTESVFRVLVVFPSLDRLIA